MKEIIVLVDVFFGEKQIDHFEFPLKDKWVIEFPKREPYQGLSYHISVGPQNTYEFSPDGYEYWVRFNDQVAGQSVEYLCGHNYRFIYKTKTTE